MERKRNNSSHNHEAKRKSKEEGHSIIQCDPCCTKEESKEIQDDNSIDHLGHLESEKEFYSNFIAHSSLESGMPLKNDILPPIKNEIFPNKLVLCEEDLQ